MQQRESSKKRDLGEPKIAQINTKCENMNWGELLSELNVKESFDLFHTTLTEIIDKISLIVRYSIKSSKLIRDPWISKSILQSIKKQKLLYRQ